MASWPREGCVSVALRYCNLLGYSWCFSVRKFGVHSARLSGMAMFCVDGGGWKEGGFFFTSFYVNYV